MSQLLLKNCRGQIATVWEKWAALGASPKVVTVLTLPLPVTAKFYQVTNCHKLLCKSPQEPLLVGGIASVCEQKCSGTSSKSKIAILSTQQPVETYLGPEHLKHLHKHRVIQNGDTRDNKNLPTGRGVGYLHRYHTSTYSQSRKYMHSHVQGRPYKFKALPLEFTVVAKEVKPLVLEGGIRIHQYLYDWLVRAKSHRICLQYTKTLVALCRELGWLVNREK